ncbi:MAG TPA: DNA polymerase III subunit beta [Planctomycetota bacterium]|jgi:DNA polymerase-3 subunit beta|nr:DNA polymerase III subunit beta [Planctomycetota bacterium]HJM38732.1 DNA polymerase III subunit beta [Planctomycetota bacterium]|tara:strand:- start:7484 stop:8617 length:1134 start_codon:yes stop_codon:yes gene_type:complete
MKFLIDRIAFRDALQRVEMAIDRKPSRPVLGGVVVEVQNDRLVVVASDLDISVRYTLNQVQVDSPGWALVPGRELVDVFKDIEADTVTVSLSDQQQFEIVGGEDHCSLVTMESSAAIGEGPEGFPTVPVLEGEPSITIAKDTFMQMIGSTRFATSRVHDTRFATEGVLFEAENGELTMVGTDGRRLAWIRRQAESGKEKQRSVLLPKMLDQIVRFGQDEKTETIEVFFLGNRVGFRIGNLESFGRVLEGEFPNYDNVIPKNGKHIIRAHRESMSRKLKLASHLTADAAQVVRIDLKTDAMQISAEHEGRGKSDSTIEVDYTGGEFSASFNPSYLLDGLKVAHAEQVELQMGEATRPAKFVLGDNFEYVVMPLSNHGS